MKAYKGFNKDMTCRDFKFEEGKEYEEAYQQMLTEVCDAKISLDELEERIDESGYFSDCEIGCTKTTAYVTDGLNHDNYDWRIVKLP